tara:strand:- start:7461 stop:9125 length:1665 start_codon:yes stop_codon:yes gene_type:complete
MDKLIGKRLKRINYSSEALSNIHNNTNSNNNEIIDNIEIAKQSNDTIEKNLHNVADNLKKELGLNVVDQINEKNDSPNNNENELLSDDCEDNDLDNLKEKLIELNNFRDENINIVISGDCNVSFSIGVLLKSIILNCTNFKRLKFFIICDNPYYLDFSINLICKNLAILEHLNDRININVNTLINYIIPCEEVLDRICSIKSFYSKDIQEKPTSDFNFIRFYFDKLLPNDINKCIYLDCDIIVKGDIEILFNLLGNEDVIGVVYPIIPYKLDVNDWIISKKYRKLLPKGILFNAGMYIFNIRSWKYLRYSEKCLELVKINKENKIYEGGTQSVMNLICKNPKEIDISWNQTGLSEGNHCNKDLSDYVSNANIIHYTGFYKPWLKKSSNNIDIRYLEEWYVYLSDLNPRFLKHIPFVSETLINIIKERSSNFIKLCNNYKLKLKYHLICASDNKLNLDVKAKKEISDISQVVEDGKLIIKLFFNDFKNMDDVPKYLSVNLNDTFDKFEVKTSNKEEDIFEIDLNISIDKSSIKAKFNKRRKTVTIMALVKNENIL